MKIKIFSIVSLAAVFLVAFMIFSGTGKTPTEHETQDIRELIHDYSVGNITNEVASISSHQLIVTDSDDNQYTYDISDEEFFVSIAPYEYQTHP